jgi:hypothetical protein
MNEVSTFKGIQQSRCLSPLTWRQKQMSFWNVVFSGSMKPAILKIQVKQKYVITVLNKYNMDGVICMLQGNSFKCGHNKYKVHTPCVVNQ